jgi:geranylgeranyl pyrophosphate synthase
VVGKKLRKDVAAGKLTAPGLMGIEEAKKQASGWANKARKALESVKGRTEPLMHMVDLVENQIR